MVLNRSIKGKAADKPFIAFANPQFSKTVASAPPISTTTSTATGAVTARGTLTRAVGSEFDYALVTPLPETLDEANAAAKSSGADPAKDVISGAAATRTRVLAEKLDDRRMVAFATHGVLPGDIPRLTKPALAMAYEGAGATVGKAQALALAQRAMASGKQGALYQHPFFWAAYFVMGEPAR